MGLPYYDNIARGLRQDPAGYLHRVMTAALLADAYASDPTFNPERFLAIVTAE